MKKLHTLAIFLIAVFTTFSSVYASVSSGTIDPSFKTTKICQDSVCSNGAAYTLNMAPSGVTQVTIDDTNGIDGVAWGSSIGWINFDPTGPEGVTINPTTGVISGKAWAASSGWVNFGVTNQQVSINNNGEFVGWAWNGGVGGGWIKFDCTDAAACIKTDWRPIPARTVTPTPAPTPSSGGGLLSAGVVDICPNLGGIQLNVPAGYGLIGNSCNIINDICPNLPGEQSTVPNLYTRDLSGMCNLSSLDMCTNIAGNQSTVPLGNIINSSGTCVALKVEDEVLPVLDKKDVGTDINQIDKCQNLSGLQVSIPAGMTLDINNSCVSATLDYCPNIDGNQSSIPYDLIINNKGECVMGLTKLDINAPVPNNIGDNRYVLPLTPTETAKDNIISYSFLPDSVKLGIKADPIAKIFVDKDELGPNQELPQVDLISIALSFSLLIFAAYRVLRFILIL